MCRRIITDLRQRYGKYLGSALIKGIGSIFAPAGERLQRGIERCAPEVTSVKRLVILVIATLICVAGCGAQQQETAAPATMTPNQQQAFHGCMKQKRQEYILPLGPIFVNTAAKQQRDYDACVAQAKAAPSAAPSPSPTKP
jgi:hypothetical protein